MTTLSIKPDPFKRPIDPAPIRSPASIINNATTSTSTHLIRNRMADLAARRTSSGSIRRDQNELDVQAGAAGSKGIAGLEARRSRLGFGTNQGGLASPFGNSTNAGGSNISKKLDTLEGVNSLRKNSLSVGQKTGADSTKIGVPTQFPIADVFYEPPTASTSKSTLFPNNAAMNRRTTGTPGSNNGAHLFKPPAPPSQHLRQGTPILPHSRPASATSQISSRSVLHTLPNPSVTNLHLNTTRTNLTGPSAQKRRKTETGSIPIPTHPSAFESATAPKYQSAKQKVEVDAAYIAKYTQAFPRFVFCFDAEFLNTVKTKDGMSVKDCKEGIKLLKGQVVDFLSSNVTHYISNRGVPAELEKLFTENAKRASEAAKINETADGSKQANVTAMATKVWRLDKLGNILLYLLGPKGTPQAAPIRAEDDLSYLLEDERLHGTRERDKAAPRADWYYFRGVHYLLVDDALGESRSIMVKEFPKQRLGEPSPWPLIYETFMRLSETAQENRLNAKQLREKAWKTYVTREQSEIEPKKRKGLALFEEHARSGAMLTRSASLNNMAAGAKTAGRGRQPDESMTPYQAASGNSVVLTSNIASTSNIRSTTGINLTPNGMGIAGIAQGKDRKIVQMSKRVQLLKGQTAAKLSAAGRIEGVQSTGTGEPVYVARCADVFDDDEELEVIGGAELADNAEWPEGAMSSTRRDSSSSNGHSGEMVEEGDVTPNMSDMQEEQDVKPYHISMDDQARQRVLAILEAARAPAKLTGFQRRELKRARSMGFRIERMNPDIPVKPGYCENCRVKYEDFEAHIIGRRHRKFAENPANFEELDEFLERVRRVPKTADIIEPEEPEGFLDDGF